MSRKRSPLESRIKESVTRDEARRRILRALALTREPWIASQFADAIWPGHRMKPQGAAVAASRIVREMQREGLLELGRLGHALGVNAHLGLGISAAGRRWLKERGAKGKRVILDERGDE